MATVGVARKIGVVLEQIDLSPDPLLLQPFLCLNHQLLENALSRFVLPHEISNAVAFGGGVLRMRTDIEVQT